MSPRSRSTTLGLQLMLSAGHLVWCGVVAAQPSSVEQEPPSPAPTPTTELDPASVPSAESPSLAPQAVDMPPMTRMRQPVLDTWGTSLKPPPPAATEESSTHRPSSAPPPSDTPDSAPETTAEPDESSQVRYHLERIEVRGNARTRPAVILRYLPFRVGKELDANDVEFTLARYRLLGTGFFREVEFSLRKGTRRGNVVLVVDVLERNTIVLNGMWMGLAKDADENGKSQPLSAFGGFDVAETNLVGTGITVGGAVALAKEQYAVRGRVLYPGLLGSPWMVNLTVLYNDAKDFFGTKPVQWGPNEDEARDRAVVPYKRFGGSVGIGRDLSVSSQLWFHYRLETISAHVPTFATYNRGTKGESRVESVAFDILPGRSVFSTVRANFEFDTRDHPFLPTRGLYVSTWGELGLLPLGSNYDFQRFDISTSYYWHKKDSAHVWRLQLFAGAMSGNVPFFEQYYVGDFSDFLPPRMLSLNVDARPAHNFFKTAIGEVRYGQFAAQVAGEYRFPVYRGHRSVYGIDFFLRTGLFIVAHRRDLTDPAPGYHGLQRIPFDLTANAGFRMDTSVGGVVFSVSNVLGFLPPAGGK